MTMAENNSNSAAKIVQDAGGQVIGRTKLQKIAYILELTGLGTGYQFQYQYYGPYSEELANDVRTALAFHIVEHEERTSDWGGVYSIYKSIPIVDEQEGAGEDRAKLACAVAEIDAIELELAATAAYLKVSGHTDPWGETKRRKPDKATDDRIKAAKVSYRQLMQVRTPSALPNIV